MEDKKQKVTIIIPTLDEKIALIEIMPRIKKEWYDELVIVDGGSTDGTIEYCKENGHTVLMQEGKGLPLAEKTAFENSTGDIIVTFSPDGNSIPELIPDLVEKMKEGYDMVIVSRYLGSAKSDDDDIVSRFGNFMFTTFTNVLFGGKYTDACVIFRAYTRDAVNKMKLFEMEKENFLRRKFFRLNSWELGSSIRAAKLKLKVSAIPGDEPDRISGTQRKVSYLKNGFGAICQIFYEFFKGRDVFNDKS
ncbi:glycosyltransferase family 2 protein [candidate division KSB1 bacterium]